MSDVQEINSENYWDSRFQEDWESHGGPSQSRFFSELAIKDLPAWFMNEMKKERLSLADWGCAQGDGTQVWAEHIDAAQITGIDFSQVAIEQAQKRYPAIRFIAQDWLTEKNSETFDIVFSSNTLEHFHEPFGVLPHLCAKAKKAVVLMLPYREEERIEEHFFSFFPDNVPTQLSPKFKLIGAKALDCREIPGTQWHGDQLLLIYAAAEWVDKLKLMLGDVEIMPSPMIGEDALTKIQAKYQKAIELEQGRISYLMKDVEKYEQQVLTLHKQIALLESSFSWKITKPLRFTKMFFQNPKRALYHLAKFIYSVLPVFIRERFQGHGYRLMYWFRKQGKYRPGDLTWKEFERTVLDHREKFKGVFIQEFIIDWDVPLYQRPQHLAAALGRQGYLVIFRTPNYSDEVLYVRNIAQNVYLTHLKEVGNITGAVCSFYSTAFVLSPSELKKTQQSNCMIYEYIDHIDPQISGKDDNVRRLLALKEYAFSGGADYIIASAGKLYHEAVEAVGAEKVLLIPNGVDCRHYRNSTHALTVLPDKLVSFRKSFKHIVGYFGAIAPWLWYDAINELVRNRPDIGFVFIGVDYHGGVERLPKADNVLYLGTVDYKILPAYAQTFDICFIPFEPGEIAQTTSPLKLFEYFALEKPVVATSDMRECVAHPEVFHGGSAKALSKAFDDALAVKDDPAFKARLAELADQNDWDERARAMEKIFERMNSK